MKTRSWMAAIGHRAWLCGARSKRTGAIRSAAKRRNLFPHHQSGHRGRIADSCENRSPQKSSDQRHGARNDGNVYMDRMDGQGILIS